MKRLLLLILFFPLAVTTIFAQSLADRQKAEQEIVVLKNSDSILPLTRLDILRLGIESDANIKNFAYPILRYSALFKNKTNLQLIALFDIADTVVVNLNKPSIVVIFDSSATSLTSLTDNDNVKAILLVKRADSLHQDYAVQVIFGAIAAHGKLWKDLPPFNKGYGLQTIGGIRLKYTIPQELGLDSAFIYQIIDSIAQSGVNLHAYPGCQILAAVNGKVIYYRAFGYHTYDRKIPVRMTDLYDLASVTKIAASAPCLMLLYDTHRLSLNQTLGQLCPQMRHSNKDTIRLINALTHQAGLTPWIPFWKKTVNRHGKLRRRYYRTEPSRRFPFKVAQKIYDGKRVKRMIFRTIKKSPLLVPVKYRYSDLSFYLYPCVVQRLTGQSFQSCLYKNFYHPLGAYRMVFNPHQYYPLDQIVPTEYDSLFRKQLIHGTVHDEGAAMMGGISGHAGLFANADDLAKLMQMYLNMGQYGGRRYLSDTTVKRWTSYQFANLGNRRGIVFDKPLLKHPERGTPSPLASPLSFGHTGFTGTFTWADPANGLLIVFLSNRVYPTRKNKKLLQYNIRTHIHDVLYQALEKQNQ